MRKWATLRMFAALLANAHHARGKKHSHVLSFHLFDPEYTLKFFHWKSHYYQSKIIKDKSGIITIYDPIPGVKYKLSIKDASDKSWVGVAKFKPDGSVEWKEYFGKGAKRSGEEIDWK